MVKLKGEVLSFFWGGAEVKSMEDIIAVVELKESRLILELYININGNWISEI